MTRAVTGLPRVPVDFNEYGAFDPMWGGLPDGNEDLREGDEVVAYDTDDVVVVCALARVVRVDLDKELVFLHVDGDSFFYEEHPTPPRVSRA
jgi:hypothetical protein